MLQEQNFDLAEWWGLQSFPGKELFELDADGKLKLGAHSNIKERIIATLSADNADTVLKNLIEKFQSVEAKVKELEIEWVAATDKLKLVDKVSNVKDYLQNVNAAGDFQRLALLVHDWEHTIYTLTEENYAAKQQLAERAESMAVSEQWKEATQAFKDIAEKWKQTGYLERNRNDKLWDRIEAARKTFFDRKRKHTDDEQKILLENLDLKLDLVARAETLAASTEWKKTTEAFHQLMDEWKGIGHTLNKKNEELWKRFQAAKSVFFEKKKEHFNEVQEEHERNYAIKLSIVERAEALKDSTEWNATAQAYAALMDEWKKAGRIPSGKSDELWKRFTEAQEVFFSTKRQHTDKIREEQEKNYELKKELLERAEELKHSNHWNEATAEMIALLEDWKKIGPIPREYGDKLWAQFNAARKHFFEQKDASRERRKQHVETQKVVRVQQARNLTHQLEKEIKDEEEKLEDFKNGLQNITPGKKAEELRLHLETLIAEGAVTLKRLKEKLAAAKTDVDSIDKKEQETTSAQM